ncbi:MAG: hypothetical protein KF716_28700 [Anaerolineae bacterium]|nr:hypothetical protein [Anaerolineae bacterium]
MTRRRSRSASSFRRERRSEERRFELLIFMGLVILLIVMSLSTSNNGRLMAIIAGGLLLMSGIIQVQRRFSVNVFTWIGAVGLLALAYFYPVLPPLWPILVLGGVLLMSFLRGDL